MRVTAVKKEEAVGTPIPVRIPAIGKDMEPVSQDALEKASHISEDESTQESESLFGTLRLYAAKSCWPRTNASCSPSVTKAPPRLLVYQLGMDPCNLYYYSTVSVRCWAFYPRLSTSRWN